MTLNFDEYETTGTGYTNLPSYSGSGFVINATVAPSDAFQVPQQRNQFYFGSANLLYTRGFSDEWAILSSQDDSLFTLDSVDLHGFLGGAQTVNFYAFDADEEQIGEASFSFDDAAAWHPLTFGTDFQNVASVRWQQADPYFTMDNIVLTPANVVPEPVSLRGHP